LLAKYSALQVGNHGGVIDGLERLPGTVTAFHLRELADTGHELVRAGWGIPWLARLLADEARGVEVLTTAEELTEQLHLIGRCAGGEPRQRLGNDGPRSRIKSRELVSKRSDSGFRRGTLRFDPLEVRLCLSELGDEWVTSCGSRAIPRRFFARRFHSKVSAIQIRIASQASSRVTRELHNMGAIAA
jgi:hypothetical protein